MAAVVVAVVVYGYGSVVVYGHRLVVVYGDGIGGLGLVVCNAPRPELQVPSMISRFRRVICLVRCISSLHHVHCIM